MTMTLSEISAMTPRSWVMRITPDSNWACISRTTSMICAWMVTSSAVVGSSAIRMSGLQLSAMAIMARWRMPPENSNGY